MHQDDFTRTVLVLKNKMYRFALSIIGDPDEAKDIVQDVMLKLWETRDELKEKRSVEAWSMTLVRNRSLDLIKRMGRKMKTDIDDVSVKLIAPEKLPDSYTIENETMEQIKQAVMRLPEKQRSVFQLRDVEGYAYLEICETLNMEMSQVKVYIFRARNAIKESLEKMSNYGQQ